jgi:hypothetical protein
MDYELFTYLSNSDYTNMGKTRDLEKALYSFPKGSNDYIDIYIVSEKDRNDTSLKYNIKCFSKQKTTEFTVSKDGNKYSVYYGCIANFLKDNILIVDTISVFDPIKISNICWGFHRKYALIKNE